ncbi:tyrosine recombinase XerC [Ruminococcaceae bacterium OttesenSCG-928-L11]|nr:tyrosine recombinase XerC [Ruminococcaceae bacterium OttesenSCG-928-L11]
MTNGLAQYNDCPQLLKDFLFYLLTIRGRSQRTVHAYYIDLRTFLRYIKSIKTPIDPQLEFHEIPIDDIDVEMLASITLSDVYAYLNYVMTQRENNAKTRSRKVSSIRAFFRYLTVNTTTLKENPVKDLEVPNSKKSMPKYLTLEESLELISHIDTRDSARDYCIITLFLNCGMRLSELVGINTYDIRGNTLKLLGKGNKERIIYLNEACLFAIDQYMQVREPPQNAAHRDALFLSKRGTRLTARRVQQIVESCLKSAGLSGKGYSPHKLRHTAATLMYQHGNVDIRVLKEILGHANLATTEIYTHVANSQIENAANQSPLSKIKIANNLTNSREQGKSTSSKPDSDPDEQK